MDAAMDGGTERTVCIIFSLVVVSLLTLFCQKSVPAQVVVLGAFRGVYIAAGAAPLRSLPCDEDYKSTARPASTSILP
jgi:hypothetical protein